MLRPDLEIEGLIQAETILPFSLYIGHQEVVWGGYNAETSSESPQD